MAHMPDTLAAPAPSSGIRSARVRGGEYAEAAARGRELLDAHPEQGLVFYNTACRESLAGQTSDALAHLARAVELSDGCRDVARGDADFDPIRNEPACVELLDR